MKNLITLRQNANITQKELAQKIGISKANIGFYELGRTQPSLETLIKLADFFGCSIDYLLGHQVNDPTRPKEATMLQRQLCQDILALDEEDCGRVEAYIAGIKAKNQEQQRIKRQYTEEDS